MEQKQEQNPKPESAPAENKAPEITLEFAWTVSRGRDTYGYNVVTLRADGRKVARCNGGGYDMQGTCLGSFLESAYADRLRALKPEDMPAQSHWQPDLRRVCEGKCKTDYNKRLMSAIADGKADEIEKATLPRLPEDCFECPTCKGPTMNCCGDGKRVEDGRYFYGLTFHDPNYDPGKAVIGEDCSDRTLSKTGSKGETVAEAEKAGKSFGLERLQAIYSASSKHATERHTVPCIDGACGFRSVEEIAKAIGITLQYVPVRSKKLSVYQLHDARAEG